LDHILEILVVEIIKFRLSIDSAKIPKKNPNRAKKPKIFLLLNKADFF
jgi:hypothetical protein